MTSNNQMGEDVADKREMVARIIDPEAWTMGVWVQERRLAEARAKADAILTALTRSYQGGEAPAGGVVEAADGELLPCPFCGGAAERIDIAEGENAGGSCIDCTVCQASSNVEFGLKENFVSNWNRRAALASPAPGVGGGSPDRCDGEDTVRLSLREPTSSYQERVHDWIVACFGEEIGRDGVERNHRFLEESLELVQALGCTQSEAHQLVDYTFGRDVGDPFQEVGGVMNTLAALCNAHDLNLYDAAEVELARVWTKVEQIRAKQAAKPKHSPLPEHGGDGVPVRSPTTADANGLPTPSPEEVALREAAEALLLAHRNKAGLYLTAWKRRMDERVEALRTALNAGSGR